jgi:hypothetical protein
MPTTAPLPRRCLPQFFRVKQFFRVDRVADVRQEVSAKLAAANLARKLKPGAQVGISAGSRGIGGFVDLLSGIVDAVKSAGGEPFVFPAMGSHGGATAEGQTEILRLLGVDEASVGAPVRATMDTVTIGASETGAVAHIDRTAYEADGIIVLGRVKTHPECTGPLASGLLKMCTIGLGKQSGAQEAHNHGLWPSIRAVPRLQLAKGNILFGVAVVENAYRQPAVIEIVEPTYDAFLEADLRLLHTAKAFLPTIPFSDLDVLVVDEIGKTISGGGMDPNIIGKWRNSDAPHVPDYRRIVVLSLTEASLGNGLGIGMADFTTERFRRSYDPAVTYMNLLTAQEPGGNTREGPMPLALPSDREALEVALYSSLAPAQPRMCRIRSTAQLDEFWASDALAQDVQLNPKLDKLSEPQCLPFDERGNLFAEHP